MSRSLQTRTTPPHPGLITGLKTPDPPFPTILQSFQHQLDTLESRNPSFSLPYLRLCFPTPYVVYWHFPQAQHSIVKQGKYSLASLHFAFPAEFPHLGGGVNCRATELALDMRFADELALRA